MTIRKWGIKDVDATNLMMNVGIAVVLGLVTFGLAALGGHVATENTRLRYTFWILSFIGVASIGWQAWRTEQENNRLRTESKVLSKKLDFVQKQSDTILAEVRKSDSEARSPLVRPPDEKPQRRSPASAPSSPFHTNDAETRRRRQVLVALRNEFILSHDGISSAMLAGLEWPPSEWVNKRLNELGEKWQVKVGSNPAEVEIIDVPS
jgi:hypothetical protein